MRALNHSLLVRRRGEDTGLEAGALDWLLYEDPDLELLRLHPRFERWASATFGLTIVNQDESLVDAWMRNRRLRIVREKEWGNDGAFGAAPRWQRSQRLWWLANDHYLIESITNFAPKIAAQWRHLAQDLGAEPSCGEPETVPPTLLEGLIRRYAEDEATWRLLASYRRYGARPDLRIGLARQLAKLAGAGVSSRPFPDTRQVLTHPLVLDYDWFDTVLSPLIQMAIDAGRIIRAVAEESLADLEAVRRARPPDMVPAVPPVTLRSGASANGARPVVTTGPPPSLVLKRAEAVQIALAAARRWDLLYGELYSRAEWRRETARYAKDRPSLRPYLNLWD